MPDDLTTPEEEVETPTLEEEEGEPDTPSEDEEQDVGALKRAYERVKEKHRAEASIWDDEQALAARLRERYPGWFEAEETVDDVDDEDEDDLPAPDPKFDWVYQREVQRAIDEDLNNFVGDRDLSGDAREWVIARAQTDPSGFNAKSLKKAVDTWFEFVDAQLAAANPKPKPKPHHVSKSGRAVSDVPDLNDRNARVKWITEQVAQRQHGT